MTPQKSKELHLPLARVKTIMKSSPDVEAVSFEASYFVAKSAVRISKVKKVVCITSKSIQLYTLFLIIWLCTTSGQLMVCGPQSAFTSHIHN